MPRSLSFLRCSLLLASAALSTVLAGCGAPEVRPAVASAAGASEAAPEGMVRIPGGTFRMGTNSGLEDEGPVHVVKVSPFYLDEHEVTNAQFAEFVKATGYKTVAEKMKWSAVFSAKAAGWEKSDGADWRHPTGPKSDIKGKDDYPVLQICWDDAAAYAKWAGKRLPTEAEFEFAARGGLEGKVYSWGEELNPGGKFLTNYWQGEFPTTDTGQDGYAGVAPIKQFPPNGYGLYDIVGNCWEWVSDYYSPTYYRASLRDDPKGPESGEERVLRGGSFLCAESYCTKYRVAGRNHSTPDSAWNHTSFRCARDVNVSGS